MLQVTGFIGFILLALLVTVLFLPISGIYAVPAVLVLALIALGIYMSARHTTTGRSVVETRDEDNNTPTGVRPSSQG